jgi:hypothetical protein
MKGFLTWFEPANHELHKDAAARFFRARAKAERSQRHADSTRGAEQAQRDRAEAVREFQALAAESDSELKQVVSDAMGLVQAGSPLAKLLQAWQRDFGPDGGYVWLRRAALLNAQRLNAGS